MSRLDLDLRFGPTLRIMRESAHHGERAAAEAQLKTFAHRVGFRLPEAIAHFENAPKPQPGHLFAGFDGWMEEQEPGWKARQATEKAERTRQRLARVDAAVARYGSKEAVLAACPKEMLLRAAVKPWRKTCARPHHRWTQSVDGYRHFLDPLPLRVANAIATAYPMPATYKEAAAEQSYWLTRRAEIEDVLGDAAGDDGLDLLAQIRLAAVRSLVETELVLTDLDDIAHRLGLVEDSGAEEPEMVSAVYRDLKAYVETGRR